MISMIGKVELKSNLKLVEFFEEESSFYLVFEMMDGSLMERLNRLKSHRSLLSSKTSHQEWAAWRGRCEKYCKVVFNASPWPLSLVWYVTDFKLWVVLSNDFKHHLHTIAASFSNLSICKANGKGKKIWKFETFRQLISALGHLHSLGISHRQNNVSSSQHFQEM